MFENDDSAIAVGKRLKRLRLMAGLSRDSLAKEAAVGVTSISYWEHAKPDSNPMKPRSVAKIINAVRRAGVECSERWLLLGSGIAPQMTAAPNSSIFLENESSDKSSFTVTLPAFDKELQLFRSSNPLTVTMQVKNNGMLPAIVNGDFVGGVWQSSACVSDEKICIVIVDGQLQVRRVRKEPTENLYHLSYLLYNPVESTPFEIKNFHLERVAPVIRIWRC